ncbi:MULTISPECIES: PAS domain S-box protein [unclassified Ketobacter]|uniref:methyl-accepting chemotaxis protein n=1 Tax=unclassified Ketobacter TaxID=2639109 RepID=UPI000F1A6919|nr:MULTISPECIES: methyl-accepting chemotaxis protein [unclassified Ketobacter]RLT90584.1 MAG: methyl-accepting chemotaxis protein [Ketobacter sp. GenoA1]RLT99682.1 MAG: methyl-accepting chemotaxis protein [Ketobacter sp.]
MFAKLMAALNGTAGRQTEQRLAELEAVLQAVDKTQARIEFDLDGIILDANRQFLDLMGYRLDEIKGKHHRLFVSGDDANSPDYKAFWVNLQRGEFQSGEFRRRTKDGREVWIQAAYNPVYNAEGCVTHCVKFAVDITTQKRERQALLSQFDALNRSQAVIQFDPEGNILEANQNFLDAMGYTLEEIQGQHHRIFVGQEYGQSPEYREFWNRLRQGKFQSATFQRFGKHGKEIWIQATYNPILDENGNTVRVIKFATDVTEQTLKNADYSGQIEAISRSQAVIAFNLDGTIQNANDNFLQVMGYTLDQIKGKHHRIFVEAGERNSPDYKAFWQALNAGKHFTGEYKRIGNNGREVWIQASYNPILDLNGNPVRVVKCATDITADKLRNADYQGQLNAISRSQAVIEFELDGTIRYANDNFLKTMGYTLEEVKGQHHRIFVDDAYAKSAEYQSFWQALNAGEFFSEEYERIAKDGSRIWIQASYNPIFDASGNPYKVVKYATDVTQRKCAVNEISSCLLALAQGDLSQRVNGEYQGEFEQLKTALNSTFDRLQNLVASIQSAATDIQVGATEIQSGNLDLSRRTESQAASLQETASSMEEMTSQLNTSTSNANSANETAKTAQESATKGKAVVDATIQAMQAISTSSKQIADIIGTIDEIAFQTNLLALNAAVEAARAGEQGRGFAVVAGEVRNLAQRSAAAAKEIGQLIKDSVNKVETGTEMVLKSGETLEEIIAQVVKVTEQVSEIADSASEQLVGIQQVNQAVSSIDESTQQNSALMEEATAATTSMVDQVDKMHQELSFFKLG